jgi:hypothetical protein
VQKYKNISNSANNSILFEANHATTAQRAQIYGAYRHIGAAETIGNCPQKKRLFCFIQ